MAKAKTLYTCANCGCTHSKWAGQCSDCGQWNTLEEGIVQTQAAPTKGGRFEGYAGQSSIKKMTEVDDSHETRTQTHIGELDRVLGGGLVAGSVVLIGGAPGIGKSTILLQTVAALSSKMNALYVTGEESLQQVAMRAKRLNIEADNIQLLTETCVESILNHAQSAKPQLMVIDSIQTIYTEQLTSAPGGVSQIRESAAQLVRYAKQTNTALFIVGHVTKEGTLAGPRVLEHMVDTVLYFDGEQGERYRLVRAVKNRFGAVNELGVFAMTEEGLKPVSNPSAIFLSRHDKPVPGSIIMVTREGSRPLLVEVQSLVDESHLGNPRRVTLGLEQNRLAMLLAVLHRHAGIPLHDQDVFVNVVGGVRVTETAADTALILSALSSFRDKAIANDIITFGEIGLAGEIRPVPNGLERLREAAKHGFKRAIIPMANKPKKSEYPKDDPLHQMEIIGVSRIDELLSFCQQE